ncbi:hypothetical protein DM02DRAFT_584192 [Periconia macrospinosa]|uniref:Galactose oxidase n=1 Tax=Periconia macrospinosa TaxID=97972 RepID=A0A2V1E559_9PLEO|nr:hypothetical protein DM02DRAFT_584192 [Periconia macrospinosa]
MAEVAAGAGIALAAEQVISTTAQVGTAGYILTKPTQPLKAKFTRIATADDEDMNRRSLTRSHHSVTVIDNKAHIFGGTTSSGEIASNDIHIINLRSEKEKNYHHEPEYQLIPALSSNPSGGSDVPAARTQHAACAFNSHVAIYGGADASGSPLEENSSIWLYDPTNKTWSQLSSSTSETVPGPRAGARLFASSSSSSTTVEDAKALFLYGGTTQEGRVSSDLWSFDVPTSTWHALPNPPVLASPTNAALVDGHLYLISSDDAISSSLHILPVSAASSPADGTNDTLKDDTDLPKWTTLTFPTNPLAPGPRARRDGALVPITTGYGRNYLVYLLGARETPPPPTGTTPSSSSSAKRHEDQTPTQWSDTWTLQLPSSSLIQNPFPTSSSSSSHETGTTAAAATALTTTIKPAHIKDTLRTSVGASSGTWSWAEVELVVPSDPEEEVKEGKLHPGPRSSFGADVLSLERNKVVFWGGVDAKGEVVGDGWVVGFE